MIAKWPPSKRFDYKLDYKNIYKDDKQDMPVLDIVRKSTYYDERFNP